MRTHCGIAWGFALFFAAAMSAQELEPARVHSGLTASDRKEQLAAIRILETQIQSTARNSKSQADAIIMTRQMLEPFKEELVVIGSSIDAAVRGRAALLLGYSEPTDEVRSLLTRLISDSVPDVQYASLAGILFTGTDTPELRAGVVALLRRSENSHLFRDATKVASSLRIPEAVEPLVHALGSDNTYIRADSAEALADMGIKTAIPQMRRALNGITEKSVRDVVERAITRLESDNSNAVSSKDSVFPVTNTAPPKQPQNAIPQQTSTQYPVRAGSNKIWLWIGAAGAAIITLLVFSRRRH